MTLNTTRDLVNGLSSSRLFLATDRLLVLAGLLVVSAALLGCVRQASGSTPSNKSPQNSGGAGFQIPFVPTSTPLPTPTPAPQPFTNEFVVDTKEPVCNEVQLEQGNRVEGEFTVQGGSGADVNFAVWDPNRIQIQRKDRAAFKQTFAFVATGPGNYCIQFDNSFSVRSNKFVKLAYTIYWK